MAGPWPASPCGQARKRIRQRRDDRKGVTFIGEAISVPLGDRRTRTGQHVTAEWGSLDVRDAVRRGGIAIASAVRMI